MPGMNFYHAFAEVSESKRQVILNHKADYARLTTPSELLIDDKHCILTCTSYAGYPYVSFETKEFRIFLEGRIYSKDDGIVRAALTELAENLVRGDQSSAHERAMSWLRDADGEFIVLIQHKDMGVVYIVTDVLGRLPLYYSRDHQSILVSRHLDLVVAVQERKTFNKLAIAYYLLFAYSLGDTTLVQDVHALEPSSIITIDPRSSSIKVERTNTWCFSEKLHSSKSLQTNATELACLLSVACQSRIAPEPRNVVSLSGGLDSRTIAACIRKTGIPASAATMVDAFGVYENEAKIAEQISQALGIDWKLFQLQAPRGKDVYRLLRMKTGLNYLAMSFILQFFDDLRHTYGPEMTYITGDGGDKVLVDLRPRISLGNLSDLVQYILNQHQIFPLSAVSRMTGLPECDIIHAISEHVASYPEKDFGSKYVHFVVFERGRRWLFEGEDRNRNFFWHLAPFYGVQFFHYAMNCPDEQKANHQLYKEVLIRISPEAASIINEHWGFPITSKRYYWTVLRQCLVDLIPMEFKKRIKQQIRPNGVPREKYKECVSKQLGSCDAIGKQLILPEVLRQLDECTKREAQTLLTVTSILELVASGGSTISEYWEDQL
jgi:asparagine synthase (glutamine-hydrolysing)